VRLASNHAHDGRDDPDVPRRRFSFAVGSESGSSWHFNSTPSGDTFQSSRSSGLCERSQLELRFMRLTYPSVRFDSIYGAISGVEASTAFESPFRINSPCRSSISETQDLPKCRTQFRWTSTAI